MNATHTTKEPHLEKNPSAEHTQGGPRFVPRIDIVEFEQELVLYADLPGVTPADLDIRYEDGELTLTGKVAARRYGSEARRSEYETGNFHRSFHIGETIDASRISADLKQGVLTLHLPKVERIRPRRIDIRVA